MDFEFSCDFDCAVVKVANESARVGAGELRKMPIRYIQLTGVGVLVRMIWRRAPRAFAFSKA